MLRSDFSLMKPVPGKLARFGLGALTVFTIIAHLTFTSAFAADTDRGAEKILLNEELQPLAHLIGGSWIGDRILTPRTGQPFFLMRRYEVAVGGAAIKLENWYVYENGSKSLAMEGFYAWSPSKNTIVHFGVMADGGIVHEASYTAKSLPTLEQELLFTYSSPNSKSDSPWRQVERIGADRDVSTEIAYILSDNGDWREVNKITSRRLRVRLGPELLVQLFQERASNAAGNNDPM